MKKFVIAIALALAGSAFNVHAQSAGGATGNAPAEGTASGGLGHGRGGQHQQQTPEKIAEELMKKFDADTDGKLSQAELTQALEALEEHHPRAGGGRGRRGRGGARPAGGSNADSSLGSDAQNGSDAQTASDTQGGNQARPSADQIAARLIEKYASDKKGLTMDELANAIREHRANRGQGQ